MADARHRSLFLRPLLGVRQAFGVLVRDMTFNQGNAGERSIMSRSTGHRSIVVSLASTLEAVVALEQKKTVAILAIFFCENELKLISIAAKHKIFLITFLGR